MAYKRMTREDLHALRGMIPDQDRVLWQDEIGEDYSHDELSGTVHFPEAVVLPVSAQEVSSVMHYAFEQAIPVTPRGAGTGLVGAAVPMEGGILLDMSRMNRLVELDEDNLTLTVEPGVLLMELSAYVEERGFFYPPDPGEKTATIGGNISTNAGGMRAVKYGVTRDYVRGLEVVLPSGDIITLGGKVVKNSTGYALKDLIVGSEGTLAVITKAILKLLPLPKRTVSLLVPFPSLKQAITAVPAIVKSKAVPTAIEFMEKEVILDAENYLGSKFPDHSADAYLLLRFDGAGLDEIEKNYEDTARLCISQGAMDVLISDTQERDDSIWKARGAFLEAIKASTTLMDEVDVVVPRSRVHELVDFIHQLRQEADIRIKTFGHAGDGNLHAYVLRDDLPEQDWENRMRLAMARIYEKAKELKGEVSGEHGIGFAKRKYMEQAKDDAVLTLMRNVKAAFDPKGILNPSKII